MSTEGCTLPPETGSVGEARRFVDAVLRSWDAEDTAWTCTQLVSELATNAVIHARTEFTLEISRSDSTIKVCVGDRSATSPAVRRYTSDATTGRGLRLVETMARRWGIERTGSAGKVVWFELDLGAHDDAAGWDDDAGVDLDALLAQFEPEPPAGDPQRTPDGR